MTPRVKIAAGLGGPSLIIGLLLIAWLLQKEETPSVSEPEITVSPEIRPVVISTSTYRIIGKSVEQRDIEYYEFGQGSTTLLLVGGIHGGYEWNSVLLAYEFIDAFLSGQIEVPNDLRIGIIPVLNPDGLYSVVQTAGRFTVAEIPPNTAHQTGQGRFNANNVDLNRNFDCKWQPKSSWRGKAVSAGTSAFSEPEAVALRDLVYEINPSTVVFWHSQANTVYASECENGVLPQTLVVMDAYATAGTYKSVSVFDAYPITGDAEGWLASINIPAVTVELETRVKTEWSRNLAGVLAVMELLSGE